MISKTKQNIDIKMISKLRPQMGTSKSIWRWGFIKILTPYLTFRISSRFYHNKFWLLSRSSKVSVKHTVTALFILGQCNWQHDVNLISKTNQHWQIDVDILTLIQLSLLISFWHQSIPMFDFNLTSNWHQMPTGK